MNDPIKTYSYQLHALAQEIMEQNDNQEQQHLFNNISKWTKEIVTLSNHFIMNTTSVRCISHIDQSGQIQKFEMYKMIEALFEFWPSPSPQNLTNNSSNVWQMIPLKSILQKLYLELSVNQGSYNPYFGLILFSVIQDQEARMPVFRSLHKLDDQFMLQLLDRTREDVAANPFEIVQIQEFVEKLINVRQLYQCSKSCNNINELTRMQQQPQSTFPLEMYWRKIMHQFGLKRSENSYNLENVMFSEATKIPSSKSHTLSKDDDDDGSGIDFKIPSDIYIENVENENDQQQNILRKSAFLYIFTCGHLFTHSQLIKSLEQIKFGDDQNNQYEEYLRKINKLLTDQTTTITGNINFNLNSKLEKHICPDCCRQSENERETRRKRGTNEEEEKDKKEEILC